jgi:hypothetical protein
MTFFSNKTYRLKNISSAPVFKGLAGFFILLVFLTLLLQWVGCSSFARYLPPGAVDGYNPDFDFRIHYLDQFIRDQGKLDCLLIGSSHFAYEVDPKVMERIYSQQTGQVVHCFNFGLPSLTAETAGPVAQALVNKYHPRLVIFEISPRSFSRRFGDLTRHLAQNPWVRYQLGENNLDGWARDAIFSYRYYLALKTWQSPYNADALGRAVRTIDERGFAPLHGYQVDEQEITHLKLRFEKTFWNGFLQVLDLQDKTAILVVESPVREDYLDDYLMGGRTAYEKFIAIIQAELSSRQIPLARAQLEIAPKLVDEMWYDSRHVNDTGAVLLSEWLGQKMAVFFPSLPVK